jgi:transitional endoplasmic reticulum ATPase
MADITEDFSFAYLKEAFVATLLDLARNADGDDDAEAVVGDDEEDDPLDKYEFWRTFKAQVKVLRDEMAAGKEVTSEAAGTRDGVSAAYDELVPLLDALRTQKQRSQEGAVDPKNPFMHSELEAGAANPLALFGPPIVRRKIAKQNDGVWEWCTV